MAKGLQDRIVGAANRMRSGEQVQAEPPTRSAAHVAERADRVDVVADDADPDFIVVHIPKADMVNYLTNRAPELKPESGDIVISRDTRIRLGAILSSAVTSEHDLLRAVEQLTKVSIHAPGDEGEPVDIYLTRPMLQVLDASLGSAITRADRIREIVITALQVRLGAY